MMLACGWILILFQVCWALKDPKTVTGPAGGSVSVQCQYSRGYEESVKYWCKETDHRQCAHHIRTAGSEEEVKQNRISIQDSHALHIFKVTMENLTDGDAGTYLCGVEKAGRYDIWYPVEVKVTADYSYVNSRSLGEEMWTGLWMNAQICVSAISPLCNFLPSNNFENKEKSTEETSTLGSTTMAFERTQSSNSVMFLVIFKILIFLVMVVAVVCVYIWHRRGQVANAKIPAT